jgi:putative MATE family efflux protein
MSGNRKQNILDDDRIGRLLVKLTLPAFMGMFVMTLYNVVDTIFIGQFVGALGIAGLSLVFPVQMMSMAIGHMMGMGGASLISRLLGANNAPRAEHALGNAISGAVILSALLTMVGLTNTDFWLRLLGSSDTILPYARDYFTIILFGMFFMTFAMSMNTLIRSEGNARVPMIGMIIGAGSNIALDAIFIIPLEMGVKGAALATVIAQLISCIYFLSYYLSGKSYLKIHSRNLITQWQIMKDILAIGIASFAMVISGSFAHILINRTVIGYGGDLAISAFGILNRIMMFAMMPGMVIGQGLQPILGYNYGARRFDRALRVIRIAVTYASIFSTLAFLVLFLSPGPLIRIFTSELELIDASTYVAKRLFLLLPLIGFIMVGSISFQAIGKAIQSIITSLARTVLFLLPMVLILPHFWQIDGVWLSFPLSDVLTFALTLGLLIPVLTEFRRRNKEARYDKGNEDVAPTQPEEFP